MQFRFVSALFFATVVTVFAVVNANAVNVNFIIASYQLSLALIILISATFGALIVALLGAVKHLSLAKKLKNADKTNKELSKEIVQLKIDLEALKPAEPLQPAPMENDPTL